MGQNAQPTLLIVDAQSVKNTDTAALKGYDAGKKVSGIKRYIAVDTQGLPHAIAVTTAEVTDRKGALQALGRCKANLVKVQSVLADGSYVGEPFAQAVKETLGEEVTVQIAKRGELHKFAVIPKLEMDWSGVKNGKLLALAADEFDVFVTVDKNLPYQQNLTTLPVAVIVLNAVSNELSALLILLPSLEQALLVLRPQTYSLVTRAA